MTPLSCSLTEQLEGIKIRILKDIRVHKRPIPTLSKPIMNIDDDDETRDDDDDDELSNDSQPAKRAKRSRLDDGIDTMGDPGVGPAPGLASVHQQQQVQHIGVAFSHVTTM